MPKPYARKPTTVEAHHLATPKDCKIVAEWVGGSVMKNGRSTVGVYRSGNAETYLNAHLGEWVVKKEDGSLWSLPDFTFRTTFEIHTP